MDAIKFCLNYTYFRFENEISKQSYKFHSQMAMGSTISNCIDILVIEFVENKILKEFNVNIIFINIMLMIFYYVYWKMKLIMF